MITIKIVYLRIKARCVRILAKRLAAWLETTTMQTAVLELLVLVVMVVLMVLFVVARE